MCKWEWPFVFIETKTNKYPLRNRSFCEILFFFKTFLLFVFIKKTEKKETLESNFVIEAVHGSY